MNPPLKFSGSDWSSWWPGSLRHGPGRCHSYYTWVWKYMSRMFVNTSSTNKDPSLWNKSKMCVFSYILNVLYEFSIQSVAVGIGRVGFPKTCPCTANVLLPMLSTCRMMSSDIRFGHIRWFLLFDSSGTHTLRRDTQWIPPRNLKKRSEKSALTQITDSSCYKKYFYEIGVRWRPEQSPAQLCLTAAGAAMETGGQTAVPCSFQHWWEHLSS